MQIDQVPAAQTSRVLTVPNLLSALRLAGVPVFLWLVLAVEEDAWALVLLAASGFSDWLDGQLARKWGQVSRLGQVLDPVADRLYILATVVGLAIRGIIPWWLVPVLLGRDVVIVALYPLLRRHGYGPLPVHFLGKAATFNLLYAFPLLLLGDGSSLHATVAKVAGWAFAVWGTALYWWAGALYVIQARRLITSRAPKAT
ncbi:MAG: CDP-alcohol phosphatidyltransferase family protein [Actinomycetes bacterium]